MKTKSFVNAECAGTVGGVNNVIAIWLGIVAATGVASHAGAGSPPDRRSITVALVPIVPERISAAELKAAQQESSRLWAPYGVELVWLKRKSECQRLSSPLACLYIVFTMKPLISGRRVEAGSLGQVDFSPDGQPLSEIRVAYEAVATLLARWDRRFGLDGPKLFRAEVVGRALGRVVAHEIGHILMGTRTHSSSGLMRHSFRASDLASWSSHTFALRPLEMAAIDARLASFDALMALSPAPTGSR